ncbi:MAG TPA: FG-GAP-like repeat-containing protein [Phycisphaerales bacterium]|nr:FG-GAP-like repeat-containing protein [Phycisphaerales bacterium]
MHRLTLAAFLLAAPAAFAQLAVTSTTPTINANNQSRTQTITVNFDRAVNPATFTANNFRVFGKLTGPVAGTLAFTNGDTRVTFTPSVTLAAGEQVLVVMSRNLQAADNSFLRAQGYTFTFTTGVTPTYHKFRHLATLTNIDPTGAQTRIYGGLACDLNHDGSCDLTTVNEVSADLRVFLNRDDGSGLFQPMLAPYTPVPVESSPNDVGDFNNDGHIDVVTSSAGDDIAVCFGNGDGTFDPPLILTVGFYPRGFGILDCDGDGDLDITVANAVSHTVSIIRSNNNGTFQPPVNMSVAGGPYGMQAADMNNDGILDLAIGCRDSQQAKILRGNGNGTFTQVSARPIGGSNWVVTCADLNNDGNMDMSAANSHSSNGSVLLGNGNGTMQAAQVVATGGHTVSTDLADLDGDGDIDWILSSYGAGEWYVYLNNGSGQFSIDMTIPAPANPSCAVPMDIDNDGDIDLVLTDEIADDIVILRNECSVDFNGDGLFPDNQDLEDFLSVFGGGACPTGNCDTIDFNNDGLFPDNEDIEDFFNVFGGGACA